jgi:signal transduction histidine kinase
MDSATPRAYEVPARQELRGVALTAADTAAAAMTVIAAVLGATAPGDDGIATAVLRATMVAAPLGAGLYAWRIPALRRFARLLVLVGLVSFATTLAESTDATLYSVGRAAGWTLELLLVVLLLAFPDGPLAGRGDRLLAGAMAATVAVFSFPTLVLTEDFQVPSPYTSCLHDCPRNVFFAGHEAGFAASAFLGTGSVLVLVIMMLVLVRLQGRIERASVVQRQALLPVLVLGMVRASLVGVLIVTRQAGAAGAVVETGAVLIAWATPAIAVAFLVGMVRARLAAERSLRTLAAAVNATPEPRALQRALAEAFGDPTFALSFPRAEAPARWIDCDGEPTSAPAPIPVAGRSLRLVRHGHGAIIGALDGDAALEDRPELLDAAAGLVAFALENHRLAVETAAATAEVRESRARIAASAVHERRRIERDLHDGAQQRLVALRIELSIVEDMLHHDPEVAAARVRELEASAEEALEELRALAHGVCPPLLADRGLPDALRAAVAHSGLPVSFDAENVSRSPPEIEHAVYFCMLEALQNVAKHAIGARHVAVHLYGVAHHDLTFEVRDDGPGVDLAELEEGVGITNMRDRLAAVGGSLRVVSRPGVGMLVAGRVPLPVGPPQLPEHPR